MSILPTPDELQSKKTIEAILNFAGADAALWKAASDALGGVKSVKIFGLVTVELFQKLLRDLRIAKEGDEPRELTPVEAIQLAVSWRIARPS